jgi:hypothetical protein
VERWVEPTYKRVVSASGARRLVRAELNVGDVRLVRGDHARVTARHRQAAPQRATSKGEGAFHASMRIGGERDRILVDAAAVVANAWANVAGCDIGRLAGDSREHDQRAQCRLVGKRRGPAIAHVGAYRSVSRATISAVRPRRGKARGVIVASFIDLTHGLMAASSTALGRAWAEALGLWCRRTATTGGSSADSLTC